MALLEEQLAAIYTAAKAVHRKELKRAEALRTLADAGIDVDRAGIHVDVVRHLLTGSTYKRRLTPPHTEYYLESLASDLGAEGLRTALVALSAHIDYLKSFHNVADFLRIHDQFVFRLAHSPGIDYPDDVPSEAGSFREGSVKSVFVNRYERDPKARQACLDIHGYDCAVCGFNFSRAYGDRGNDFIHVHHVTPLAAIGKDYAVDPGQDLVPVCPNCHAMLHRGGDVISVDALKDILLSGN